MCLRCVFADRRSRCGVMRVRRYVRLRRRVRGIDARPFVAHVGQSSGATPRCTSWHREEEMDRRDIASSVVANETPERARARTREQEGSMVRRGTRSRLARSLAPRLSSLSRLSNLEKCILSSRLPDPRVLMYSADWRPESLDHACVRCGVTVSRFEIGMGDCGECRGRSSRILSTIRLGRYAPPLSQWVPAVKSRCWSAMARALGEMLARQVLAAVDERRLPMPDAIVPVPVHWSRSWIRGIDHTRELSEAIGRSMDRPVSRLLQVRLAVRQAGTTRSQRLANRGRYEFRCPGTRPNLWPNTLPHTWQKSLVGSLGGLFGLVGDGRSQTSLSKGRAEPSSASLGHLLLIDDVRTTGASSEEAAECLLNHGAKSVSLAVCAVSDPPRRNALRRQAR
jgi:predicted amidophosphoribosyltransferase